MPDQQDDLRATAQSVGEAARKLSGLEQRKLALDPTDPEVARISRDAERLGEDIAVKTTVERILSQEVAREDRETTSADEGAGA
jgi:hypothetical protein